MYEKVSPCHPDKIADRIAGAMVDLAYQKQKDPKIAVEVLVGHGKCHIIAETSVHFLWSEVAEIVARIAGSGVETDYAEYPQDAHLSDNQKNGFRCGDNGIFKGVPVTTEQKLLTNIAKAIYRDNPYDGKYILDEDKLIVCQSNCDHIPYFGFRETVFNPLGHWTGGTDVDTGATNRKLGSDMGDSVTGGGLHGKDISKADVSVNIYAWLKAQKSGRSVEISCAIGDTTIDGKPYSEIIEIARDYIDSVGGFEKFAEWGLIR